METVQAEDSEMRLAAEQLTADGHGSAGADLVEQPFLSTLDIFLLIAVLCAAVYYLYFRNQKDRSSENGSAGKSFALSNTAMQASTDSGFVSKMKSGGRNVVVFYGSQTGTAEEFAGRLAKEASRYGLKAMIADPEECDMEELSQLAEIEKSLAIFVLATYGEGDPTDNAQELYNWLLEGSVDLTGTTYVVFGLGNKTYEHYNKVGIYADQRLEELGATRVFELGLGDDDSNLEDDFIIWKERFWPAVCDHFNLEISSEEINMRQYRLAIPENVLPEKTFKGEMARLGSFRTQKPPFDPKNPYLTTIKAKRELNKGGDRSCMHVELNIAGSKIRYDCGDHVAIYPTNDETLVTKLGELLNTDLDTVFSLINLDEDSHKKNPFPCPTTYRTALSHYVDITAMPYSHVLKEIAEFATDPKDQEQLKLMSSNTPEGKKLYHSWVHDDCRNIVSILEDLPSCKPPMDYVCELMPRLQARYYSISSCPKLHPDTIHVTAVLVEYTTNTGRKNRGVCTSWLASKEETNNNEVEEIPIVEKIPIYVRKSQFRLPAQPHTPILMIGPGTGLAPFRGFIQERQYLRKQGKTVGDTILFFGCRKASEDFLYEEELKEWVADGTLTSLHLAFSRDTDKKVYVTHLLRQQAEAVWKCIGEQKGHLYVCGDAKSMARDVHNIIKEICMEQGSLTEEETIAFMKKMESQKKYSADVWS